MVREEELKCEKFYMGLRDNIRKIISSWRDYSDLVQIALRLEMSQSICQKDKGDRAVPEKHKDRARRPEEVAGPLQHWSLQEPTCCEEGSIFPCTHEPCTRSEREEEH